MSPIRIASGFGIICQIAKLCIKELLVGLKIPTVIKYLSFMLQILLDAFLSMDKHYILLLNSLFIQRRRYDLLKLHSPVIVS